jgi:hypothetical protein
MQFQIIMELLTKKEDEKLINRAMGNLVLYTEFLQYLN